MDKRRGSILMITLWIVAILVIFAVSLGYRASIELRLSRYQKERLKARLLTEAAINKAVLLLKQSSTSHDTIAECGISLGDNDPREVFSQNWDSKISGFKIGYTGPDGEFVYGLTDEDSRININGISGVTNEDLLIQLLQPQNIADYQDLAEIIIDWVDSDEEPDKDFYKNKPLRQPQELLSILEYFYGQTLFDKKEIQKKAQEVYNELKDKITVYGDKVNINTASEEALRILAYTKAGPVDPAFADTLVQKIIERRQQENGSFTTDTAINDFANDLGAGSEETTIYNNLKACLVVKSRYFRIMASGYLGDIAKRVTVIYDRDEKKFVYWHEN